MRIHPLILALPVIFWVGACEMDVEEKGEMPSVDVDAKSGQLPEYEVVKKQEGEMPQVDVDAESGKLPEVEVRGPDVEVETETVEVPVPDVDVDMPKEQNPTPGQ